eukprot:comp23294_c0_seq2/m.38234 comp23294_c0_seq2/g.38234  ORF comp23294_c0_seq2/g.38234 comp23294_c0_seq2/m.38234 type:complete len:306 (-) comp23294_c0_seq2:227-1144(-)
MEDDAQDNYQGVKEERRSRSRSPIRHRDSITEHDERPESESRGNREERKGVSLYVSGLANCTREADLLSKFSAYGKVVHVSIIKDPHTQGSRGFGFVAMSSEDEAEQALAHMNRASLDGRNITVEMARRPRPHSPTPGRYHGSKGMDVGRREDRFRSDRAVGTRYGYEDRYRSDPDLYRRPYASDYDRGYPPPRSVYERAYSDLRGDRYEDRYDRYRLTDPLGREPLGREPLGREPLGRDYRDTRDYARDYYARPASSSLYMPSSRDDRFSSLGLSSSSRYDSLAPPRSAAYGRRERSRSPYTYR